MAIDVAQTIAVDIARRDPVNGIRIVGIDGPSGSGKSFLAAQISKLLAAAIIEIDASYRGTASQTGGHASMLAVRRAQGLRTRELTST